VDGLKYMRPFDYDVVTAELAPSLSIPGHWFSLLFTPRFTAGSWKADSLDGAITSYGASLAGTRTMARTAVQLAGEVEHTTTGAIEGFFSGVSLDFSSVVSDFMIGAGARVWRTPQASEWGYSAYVSRMVGERTRFDVQIARAVTDPVLATPGSFGASFSVSWRVASQTAQVPNPVASIGLATPDGRKVRFTIEMRSASSAAVSGSFTDWNPIAMEHKGNTFSIELLVPPGTYQYGFLINGTRWYLPDNVNGVVDDGFGRKNATLVVD